MIELHFEHDYLVCDVDEWVAERTNGINIKADTAMSDVIGNAIHNEVALEEWLDHIGATGLYHEGPAQIVHTSQEGTFLSHDLAICLAHTCFGNVLFVARADAYGYGPFTAYNFTGDDDADAYGYTSGWAICSCANGYRDGSCDAEFILNDGGITLWQNGGGMTVRVDETTYVSEVTGNTVSICPRCHMGNLTYWSN